MLLQLLAGCCLTWAAQAPQDDPEAHGKPRSYWLQEFPARGKAETAKAIAPVLNKVGEWDTTAFMRNIIGQAHNKFDPRYAMDRRRIFIANLSKGAPAHSADSLNHR